ncbi:MAG: hypothetical protein Q9219_004568 [cf. Caloplaca sp. 3 TL-2023]
MYISYPHITFRYLDLSNLPSHLLRAQVNLTEAIVEGLGYRHTTDNMQSVDDYYAAPLRRVFYVLRKKTVLEYVTTLILDGLVVPAALLREILCDDPFNVRILSLRGVKDLSDQALMQILRYLIRPSRPEGSPKLKALYHFTRPVRRVDRRQLSSRPPDGVTTSPGSQLGQGYSAPHTLPFRKTWVNGQGPIFRPDSPTSEAWAQLLLACQGIITFDTIVCPHGPGSSLPPRLASIALGAEGCQTCHSAPEEPLVFDVTPPHELPLLPPAPLFASTVKAAQSVAPDEGRQFYARCEECLTDRLCERCSAWWCENCYTPSTRGSGATQGEVKVHMGFCVHKCLVEALWSERILILDFAEPRFYSRAIATIVVGYAKLVRRKRKDSAEDARRSTVWNTTRVVLQSAIGAPLVDEEEGARITERCETTFTTQISGWMIGIRCVLD